MLEGLQASQNRCRECLESAGEDVSPPSGPKEGARGAQGTQSGGVRAVMVAKNEPGRSQEGTQESQKRTKREQNRSQNNTSSENGKIVKTYKNIRKIKVF